MPHPRGNTKSLRPRVLTRNAFSLLELIAVIGIIALLVALIVPVLSRARVVSRAVVCTSNLHELASVFHAYATDNSGVLPDPSSMQVSWQQSLRRYVSNPKLFVCPADEELYPPTGLTSYDWRDTGVPNTTLAGRNLSSIRRSTAVMIFDALPQWHYANMLNVARVDGTSLAMEQQECFKDLETSIER